MGLRASLGLLAGINFAGMCFTALLPETKGKSLEELNGEDRIPVFGAGTGTGNGKEEAEAPTELGNGSAKEA